MTKFTTEAIVVIRQSNIIAAKELMIKFYFQYVLPGFFLQDPRQNFLVEQLDSGVEETSILRSLTVKPDVQKSNSFHWFTTFVEPINVL